MNLKDFSLGLVISGFYFECAARHLSFGSFPTSEKKQFGGVGNYLFLCAQGWLIQHPSRVRGEGRGGEEVKTMEVKHSLA